MTYIEIFGPNSIFCEKRHIKNDMPWQFLCNTKASAEGASWKFSDMLIG